MLHRKKSTHTKHCKILYPFGNQTQACFRREPHLPRKVVMRWLLGRRGLLRRPFPRWTSGRDFRWFVCKCVENRSLLLPQIKVWCVVSAENCCTLALRSITKKYSMESQVVFKILIFINSWWQPRVNQVSVLWCSIFELKKKMYERYRWFTIKVLIVHQRKTTVENSVLTRTNA